MRMQMTWMVVAGLMAVGTCAFGADAPSQQQIVLTIMTPQINSFAPGIDAAVALTPEQANQLAAAYRDVFGSSAVVLANMVLQDGNTSAVQRQVASATLQQAQNLFAARGRAILTPAQTQLVDKTQAAFTKVYNAAQEQMVAAVKANFTTELDSILNPTQKAAMMKARAEIEAANKKAQEQKNQEQKPATAPATTPPAAPPAGG